MVNKYIEVKLNLKVDASEKLEVLSKNMEISVSEVITGIINIFYSLIVKEEKNDI